MLFAAIVAPGCAAVASGTVALEDAAPLTVDAVVDAYAPGRCGRGAVTTDAAVPWRDGTWRLFDDDFETWRPAPLGEAIPLSSLGFSGGDLCRSGGRFYYSDASTVYRASPSFSRTSLVVRAFSPGPQYGEGIRGSAACAPAALFVAAETVDHESAIVRFDDPEGAGCVLWSARHDNHNEGIRWVAATATFVAWAYDDDRTTTLRVSAPDGGDVRTVLEGDSVDRLRAEGDRMVFARRGDLWLYTHSSRRLENLSQSGTVRGTPDLSGDRVAWLDEPPGSPPRIGDGWHADVRVMDLRDRVSTRLTSAPAGRPVLRADVSIGDDWVVWIERARSAQVVPWQPEPRTQLRGYHLGARREVTLAREPFARYGTRIVDDVVFFSSGVPTLAWGANNSDHGTYRLALPAIDALPPEPVWLPDGALGGGCRATGPACDGALVCNPLTETCAAEVATGAPCDGSGLTTVCADRRLCASVGGAAACAADYTIGGRCRLTTLDPGACEGGLRCGLDDHCVEERRDGASCDPTWTTTICAGTQSACVPRASGPVCAPKGSHGAGCRLPWNSSEGSPRCDGALVCGERRLCLEVVPEGAPCDPEVRLSACARGATCVASAGGHRCVRGPYAFERVPETSFPDACARGVRLPLVGPSRDETHSVAPVEIPFAFRFYGVAQTAVWPSLNGYAVFGHHPPQENTRGPLPLQIETDVVAPLLRDLALGDAASGLCAAVFGEAPARRLVVGWESVRRRGRPDDRLRVALVLREDGAMEFAYDSLGTAGDAGAWVFVQGPRGTLPSAYDGSPANGTTLRLRPAP